MPSLFALVFLMPLWFSALAAEPISPINPDVKINKALARLGQALFHDPRLSVDDTISCATCHVLPLAGVDNQPVSIGVRGQTGIINTPTVYNSDLNFVQFWDGRARTLEAQVEFPITAPHEMDNDWPSVTTKLRKDKTLVKQFAALFAEGISKETIARSLAEFERSLITPNSQFDNFLRGDKSALTGQQQRGYATFKRIGCVSCHQGRLVGANMYEKMGIFEQYLSPRGDPTLADLGRYNVTQDPHDKYEFKVPSLRLVKHTAPYFHDGSAKTLDDAIRLMGRYQLGRQLNDDTIADIKAFLESLAGDLNHYQTLIND